jgi:hypothetical protein
MSAIRTAAIAVGFLVTMLLPACGQRQAEVGSAPAQPAQVSVQVNNTLGQAVNVYVSVNGTDTFLRQVAANSNVTIPVPGFATGTTATLKAVTFDGGRTYSRPNVTLTGTTTFQLP